MNVLQAVFLDIESLGVPAELQPVVWAVAALVAAFILESAGLIAVPDLRPRGDILGVVTLIFGHADFSHLIGNVIGLAFLMSLYLLDVPDPWSGLAVMAIVPGLLYWATGPSNVQARGASVLVFALAGWWSVHSIATGGVLELIGVSIVIFFGGMLDQMNPFRDVPGVGIMGHFWGFVVGALWTAWDLSLFDPYLNKWSLMS